MAAELPDQLEEEVKAERLDELMALQQDMSRQRLSRHVGKVLDVLVEDALPDGSYEGRTRYQAPDIDGVTHFTGPAGIHPGEFVKVRITDSTEYDLEGVAEDVAGQ